LGGAGKIGVRALILKENIVMKPEASPETTRTFAIDLIND